MALIDVNTAFRTSHVPEREIIIPGAVHPGLKGYALMARTICQDMAARSMIVPHNEWQWHNLKSDDHYFEELGVTALFLHEVYNKVSKILAEWPGLEEEARYYCNLAGKYRYLTVAGSVASSNEDVCR